MSASGLVPAGFVEYDEAPADAVLRELQEETGLIGKIDRLLDVFPKKDDGMANIVIVYAISIIGGTLSAADDAEEVAWCSCDKLPQLVFLPVDNNGQPLVSRCAIIIKNTALRIED
ncbi:MAG: NUDIX hydrolase [Anaerolineae bacterium]|nr:NUDIX hydrolase [Anaerolineae bacterium]